MAGHSKWANIQYRKSRQDAKRGKLFTKLIREITVAAKLGGADPGANPRLRTAVDSGLENNLPKDTIERAIQRGTGGGTTGSFDEVTYEGYGPGGVAIMVDCMTDNRNRTVAEVRHVLSKCGGNLGENGSVAYLFTKIGLLSFASGVTEDKLMEIALEAGADDLITNEDGSVEVITAPESFMDIKQTLVKAGLKPEISEMTMQATTSVVLDASNAPTMVRLLDMLEALDDVQKVYSNADLPIGVMTQLD